MVSFALLRCSIISIKQGCLLLLSQKLCWTVITILDVSTPGLDKTFHSDVFIDWLVLNDYFIDYYMEERLLKNIVEGYTPDDMNWDLKDIVSELCDYYMQIYLALIL